MREDFTVRSCSSGVKVLVCWVAGKRLTSRVPKLSHRTVVKLFQHSAHTTHTYYIVVRLGPVSIHRKSFATIYSLVRYKKAPCRYDVPGRIRLCIIFIRIYDLLSCESCIVCSRVLPVCRHRPVLQTLDSSTYYAMNPTMATMKVNSHNKHTEYQPNA